ncbi:MAG: lipopolysaccharide assembly protein LapA domain-containing protein [Crocinitomicaceae bacterium]|nr:lipopolysaccharide assembly protein LapA domain-containing protein [Crocinitomicaceae bacterium]
MKEWWQGLKNQQKVKYIISAVSGLLVLIFAIVNWKSTNVNLLVTTVRIPVTLLIVLSLAGGFGLATLFDYRKFKKKDKEIKSLKSQLTMKEAEDEI